MKRKVEERVLTLPLEVRADDDAPPRLVGHAAVFNQWSTIQEWFGAGWEESVTPGAFRKTLQEQDIRALWNHDPNIVLGRNKSGTLELREDEKGLLATITPPDNEWGRPVLEAVRRGDVSGMSIAFHVVKEEWTRPEKGSTELPKRMIKEAKLYDVSPVTYPAFPQTDIAARSLLSAGDDNLSRAVRVMQWADMGMPLADEDMAILRAAIEMMQRYAGEPGAPDEGANHSSTTEPEPGMGHHSVEELRRVLELCEMQMRLSGGHDD